MDLLGRDKSICDGEFAGRKACVCGHPERHRCPECGLVASEVVPADQLAGAVEALRQVREQFANGRGGYDENDPVVRIVNAALERHGGQ